MTIKVTPIRDAKTSFRKLGLCALVSAAAAFGVNSYLAGQKEYDINYTINNKVFVNAKDAAEYFHSLDVEEYGNKNALMFVEYGKKSNTTVENRGKKYLIASFNEGNKIVFDNISLKEVSKFNREYVDLMIKNQSEFKPAFNVVSDSVHAQEVKKAQKMFEDLNEFEVMDVLESRKNNNGNVESIEVAENFFNIMSGIDENLKYRYVQTDDYKKAVATIVEAKESNNTPSRKRKF